jgi:hypothetical protein
MVGKSVIIVGAGASVEFGLPSGRQILEGIRTYKRLNLPPFDDEEWGLSYDRSLDDFNIMMNAVPGQIHNGYNEFQRDIAGGAAVSIDEFSSLRPNSEKLAKLWTVRAIFKELRQAYPRCEQPRFAINGRTGVPNWLVGVARLYCQGKRFIEELDPESLTIVTFNYDRLVEVGLANIVHRTLPSQAGPDEVRLDLMPRVIHVHGSFDALPRQPQFQDVADQWARIRFVHETLSQQDELSEVVAAQDAIRSAERLFCVGFAFNDDNCRILGLPSYATKVIALDFNGLLLNKLAALGVPGGQIVGGTRTAPLSLGEAADVDNAYFERQLVPPPPKPGRRASRKRG